LERLKLADVVMFTGGDQLRLTSILGGTEFHNILLHKYINEDFIYAGTSAGAAAASYNMIYQGSSSEALLKGEVKITSGLSLIDNVINGDWNKSDLVKHFEETIFRFDFIELNKFKTEASN
jgi:cyanophycinase